MALACPSCRYDIATEKHGKGALFHRLCVKTERSELINRGWCDETADRITKTCLWSNVRSQVRTPPVSRLHDGTAGRGARSGALPSPVVADGQLGWPARLVECGQVHAIHFKGSLKPWNFLNTQCPQVKRSRVVHIMKESSAKDELERGHKLVGLLVRTDDDLIWDAARGEGTCISASRRSPVYFNNTRVALSKQCCWFQILLIADWWFMHKGSAMYAA